MGAKPELSEREFIEAVLYRARTGAPWRDLPEQFGDWNAVYQRWKRWRLSGVWQRLFASLPADSPAQEVVRLFADSTIIRAHPHAAGGGEKGGRRRRAWGAAGAASPPKST